MNRLTATLVFSAAMAAAGQRLHAQFDLREALKDSVGAHWIYDDFPRAVEHAKQTGRPLLVLFRCVP